MKIKRKPLIYFYYLILLSPFLVSVSNIDMEMLRVIDYLKLLSIVLIIGVLVRLVIYPYYLVEVDGKFSVHKELSTVSFSLSDVEKAGRKPNSDHLFLISLKNGKKIKINSTNVQQSDFETFWKKIARL